ncbi:MAG: zinc ribbon domain-containing protein [Bacteroidia bacterium]
MSIFDETTTLQEKLEHLVQLQVLYNRLNALYQEKGELPRSIEDKEDQLLGHRKVLDGILAQKRQAEERISFLRNEIEETRMRLAKWEKDLTRIRNDAQYSELRDQIDAANIDIQKKEKEIRQVSQQIEELKRAIQHRQEIMDLLEKEIQQTQDKLEKIKKKISKPEKSILKRIEEMRKKMEEMDARLLKAFDRRLRIFRDKRAVVGLSPHKDRMACGGCFVLLPRQIQLEVQRRDRLVLCENCGRILVDNEFLQTVERSMD